MDTSMTMRQNEKNVMKVRQRDSSQIKKPHNRNRAHVEYENSSDISNNK
jgi:hypothetical protein